MPSWLAHIARSLRDKYTPRASQHEIKEHWSDPASYSSAWSNRAAMAAQLAGSISSACDLGCGPRMILRDALPPSVRYVPCDRYAWTPETVVCDLTAGVPVAAIQDVDMTFALGVLEYLPDVQGFFRTIAPLAERFIFSYCSIDSGTERNRYWVNDLSGADVIDILHNVGYHAVDIQTHDSAQRVYSVRREHAPP